MISLVTKLVLPTAISWQKSLISLIEGPMR